MSFCSTFSISETWPVHSLPPFKILQNTGQGLENGGYYFPLKYIHSHVLGNKVGGGKKVLKNLFLETTKLS